MKITIRSKEGVFPLSAGAEEDTFDVVGTSSIREDGFSKVSGKAKFSTDISQANMLFGKILYSNQPHARIVDIDISKALFFPGVKAVITARDVPNTRYGQFLFDRPILARDYVLYIGDPIAAVAAISEKIAEEALKLIIVNYEELPAVFIVEEAIMEDAPILHPNLCDYGATNPYIRYGNVCMDACVSQGDPEAAFANADYVIEQTYKTQGTHQGYLEPHACVAEYDYTGRYTVWMSTQQLSWDHASLAKVLDVPMTHIRVIPTYVGGGFGGKLNISIEPICCILTKITSHPVKITLTREEEFFTQHPRAPFQIKLKTGVMADGTIIAQDADILANAGAYADQTIGTATKAAYSVQGCYFIPNCFVRTRVVYTNNIDWGCMRGYGTLEMNFALEAHLDLIANEIGIDPVNLRYKNLAHEGDRIVSGQKLRSVHIRETMDKALKASEYWRRKGQHQANIGIGIANVAKTAGLLASSASVRVNEDASISIMTSITDIGTGAHTVFRQIVAEVLTVPIEQVQISSQDSDTSPFDIGSQASRAIFSTGNAVLLAAKDVRDQILKLAATTFGCDVKELKFIEGSVRNQDSPESVLNFKDLVGLSLYKYQGPLLGHGSYMSTNPIAEVVGNGFYEHVYPSFTFSTQIAVVEVDPDTGKVKVLDWTSCHDVGKALNPNAVEGQIEGAVMQGVGFTLYEEMITKNGRVLNPNFVDYKMPTALDSIDIKIILVEIPDDLGPFGGKGIGEAPIIGVAPAIVNAIYDATGVQINKLPINPERLCFALQSNNKSL